MLITINGKTYFGSEGDEACLGMLRPVLDPEPKDELPQRIIEEDRPPEKKEDEICGQE